MQFKIGEKVLCFHGPLLYTAKILKAENRTADEGAQIEAAATQEGYVVTTSQAGPFYFVHYQGWKQTWDEWVPETRLMKFIDENLQFSKRLAESYRGSTNSKPAAAAAAAASSSSSSAPAPAGAQKAGSAEREDGSSGGGEDGPPGLGARGADGGSGSGGVGAAGRTSGVGKGQGGGNAGRGAKRSREVADQEDEYVKRPEVKIPIPEPLKVILVDDWERVTKNSQLVQLPRRPCVQQVLEDYKEHYNKHRKGAKRTNATTLAEVLDGLRLYFDKSLTHNLLYRFERLQYTEFRKAWMKGQERDAFNVTGQEFVAGVRSRTDEEVAKDKEKEEKDKEKEKAKEKEVAAVAAAAGATTAAGDVASSSSAATPAAATSGAGSASAPAPAPAPTPTDGPVSTLAADGASGAAATSTTPGTGAGAEGTAAVTANNTSSTVDGATTGPDGDGDITMDTTSGGKTSAVSAPVAAQTTAAVSTSSTTASPAPAAALPASTTTPATTTTATTPAPATAAAKGKGPNRGGLAGGLLGTEVVSGTAMRQRDDLMEPSRIYGAEHLLRLFVNLPALVAHTTLDSESIQILKDHLNEFMTYMTRERDRIFVKEYEPASVEYHRLSGI
ncbi:hypothetical protein CF328_g904 [Tilletia controversa]|nr:hypothetical protein CF328_g904 [Tilletia controversa]